MMNKYQVKIQQEAEDIELQLKALGQQKEILLLQLKQVQARCSHPDKHTYSAIGACDDCNG